MRSRRRSCTDIFCFVLFIVFLLTLVILLISNNRLTKRAISVNYWSIRFYSWRSFQNHSWHRFFWWNLQSKKSEYFCTSKRNERNLSLWRQWFKRQKVIAYYKHQCLFFILGIYFQWIFGILLSRHGFALTNAPQLRFQTSKSCIALLKPMALITVCIPKLRKDSMTNTLLPIRACVLP